MSAKPVLCIGSALWDIIASATAPMQDGTDIGGSINQQLGGVALNVAVALVQQGQPAALLTAIGNDPEGDSLIAELATIGVDCSYITRSDDPTDAYLAIEHPNGDVFGAIADCASLEKAGRGIFRPLHDGRLGKAGAPWDGAIVVDGNLPETVMESMIGDPAFSKAHMSYVPASPGKAHRLRNALRHSDATLYVNLGEAEILCKREFSDSRQAALGLLELGATRVTVTDGPRMAAFANDRFCITATPETVKAISTTGAGDVFMAAHIAAEQRGGHWGHMPESEALEILQAANDAATRHITRGKP